VSDFVKRLAVQLLVVPKVHAQLILLDQQLQMIQKQLLVKLIKVLMEYIALGQLEQIVKMVKLPAQLGVV
jgi:hypothetical protein